MPKSYYERVKYFDAFWLWCSKNEPIYTDSFSKSIYNGHWLYNLLSKQNTHKEIITEIENIYKTIPQEITLKFNKWYNKNKEITFSWS
jgi:triacylglycerol esterase/lipase EstA (alpha/beta hydrolase family)